MREDAFCYFQEVKFIRYSCHLEHPSKQKSGWAVAQKSGRAVALLAPSPPLSLNRPGGCSVDNGPLSHW